MKRKPFFESSLRKIDDELADINPTDFFMDLGEILPGEKIVGEMNDFEKRAFIWISVMQQKALEIVGAKNNDTFYLDQLLVDQLIKEMELITSKIDLLHGRIAESVLERFGDNRNYAFRKNFQIVLSNRSEADLKKEIEQLKKAAQTEVVALFGKKNTIEN